MLVVTRPILAFATGSRTGSLNFNRACSRAPASRLGPGEFVVGGGQCESLPGWHGRQSASPSTAAGRTSQPSAATMWTVLHHGASFLVSTVRTWYAHCPSLYFSHSLAYATVSKLTVWTPMSTCLMGVGPGSSPRWFSAVSR